MARKQADENLIKHKLDFIDAYELFAEGNLYVVQSVFDHESRFLGIGKFRGAMTTVVFVPRGEIIRLISWRRSREEEIKRYKEEHEKPNRS